MNKQLLKCKAENEQLLKKQKEHDELIFFKIGKYVNQDFNESISLYKEATLHYNNYAKNNLEMIHKHGFKNKVKKNIAGAIEYFNEAISQKNNILAMYNLAHLYIYQEPNYNKAIEYLIKSSEEDFQPSKILLSIVLYKKIGLDIDQLKEEMQKYTNSKEMLQSIIDMILDQEFDDESQYDDFYESFKEIDYLYDYKKNPVFYNDLLIQQNENNQSTNIYNVNISSQFYEGFGIN